MATKKVEDDSKFPKRLIVVLDETEGLLAHSNEREAYHAISQWFDEDEPEKVEGTSVAVYELKFVGKLSLEVK